MIDIIKIKLVNALTDGFPFCCPFCNQVDEHLDYLRIYLRNNPNPRCIHLKCLLPMVGFSKEEIHRSFQHLESG
jgi:hypothetical protein